MRTVRLVPALLLSIVAGSSLVAQQRVSGRVLDDAGLPVTGARIRAVPLAAVGAAAASREANAAGAADGSFALNALPAGLYQLCADAPGKELLDPCLWDKRPTPVTVGDRPLTGMAVQLKRGATLSIRVDDPGKTVQAAEKSGKGHLLVGVWSANGTFHPARVTTEDAGGRTYSLTLPVGIAAKLSVNAMALNLRDTAGKAIAGGGVSVDVAVPAAGQAFRYSVTP